MTPTSVQISETPIQPPAIRTPPRRRDDLICHELDGEAVLYDETYDVTFRLNHTALMIWNACDGATRLDQIAQRLMDAYDVSDEVARADVHAVVPQMVEAGLILTAPETTHP